MRVSPVASVDAFGFRASLAPTATPAAAAAAAAGVNFNLLPAQGCLRFAVSLTLSLGLPVCGF